MSTAVAERKPAAVLEQVIVKGDLSKLTEAERISYYAKVCESVGLNPFTRPFEYLTLNGKMILYARKDCTEQLRARDGVSIVELHREVAEGVYLVTAHARNKDGREDLAIGAVNIEGLKGEAKANAMMKAETKAKRRVTLSICGLGMLDETEVESIPSAGPSRITTEQASSLKDLVAKKGRSLPQLLTFYGRRDVAELMPDEYADAVAKLGRAKPTKKELSDKVNKAAAAPPGMVTEDQLTEIDLLSRELALTMDELRSLMQEDYADCQVPQDMSAEQAAAFTLRLAGKRDDQRQPGEDEE